MKRNKNKNPTAIKLLGTGPLSFEVTVGTTLAIRRYLPSTPSRPTIGSGFKTSAFVVYKGITKVGRINPKEVEALKGEIPATCVVLEVDATRNLLIIGLAT